MIALKPAVCCLHDLLMFYSFIHVISVLVTSNERYVGRLLRTVMTTHELYAM